MVCKANEKIIRFGAMIALLVFILCWLYLFVDVFANWAPTTLHRVHPPFSYIATYDSYHTSIFGLLYNESNAFPEPRDPPFFPLVDLLSNWPPDNTETDGWLHSQAHPKHGKSVPRFDYSDSAQKSIAEKYRRAEVPFILYNVPEVINASLLFTLPKLKENFGPFPRMVERSSDNHFMYYRLKNEEAVKKKFPMWSPPQVDLPLTFSQFVEQASHAESISDFATEKRSLYYMTINAAEVSSTRHTLRILLVIVCCVTVLFLIVNANGYCVLLCHYYAV